MRKRYNISTVIAVSLLVSVSFCCSTGRAPAAAEPNQGTSDLELSQDNDRVYDEIWNLVSAHFLYRDRLQNWASWRHRYDGRMKTKASSNIAINEMLDSLSDEYTFFRDETATEEKKVLRKKEKVVEHKMLDGQIGYIRITTFNSLFCVPETASALIDLTPANGLVLDLRGNWGGSINSTFDVFSLLTNSGKFVTMKGTTDYRDSFEEMTLADNSAVSTSDGVTLKQVRISNLTGKKPIVVLVDQNTKSAAEMLAGALRDNGRATVIGCRTFGKGIVQRVWEFPNNTSIKISSARYYLPSGTNIHQIGLAPDVYVDLTNVQKRKPTKLEFIKSQPTRLCSSKNKTFFDSLYQSEKIAHGGQLSGDSESTSDAGRDLMLTEARTLLRRKLVSLANP